LTILATGLEGREREGKRRGRKGKGRERGKGPSPPEKNPGAATAINKNFNIEAVNNYPPIRFERKFPIRRTLG